MNRFEVDVLQVYTSKAVVINLNFNRTDFMMIKWKWNHVWREKDLRKSKVQKCTIRINKFKFSIKLESDPVVIRNNKLSVYVLYSTYK